MAPAPNFGVFFGFSRPFSTEVDFSLNEFLVLEHPEIIAYWFFMFKLVVATRPRSNIDQISVRRSYFNIALKVCQLSTAHAS